MRRPRLSFCLQGADRAGTSPWRSDAARGIGERPRVSAVPAFIVTALVGGKAGVRNLARRSFRMLTSLHLISIDEKTNRVVERAAIQGPGGGAVADRTLWVTNRSNLLRLRLA
jgi:hypothetical protein